MDNADNIPVYNCAYCGKYTSSESGFLTRDSADIEDDTADVAVCCDEKCADNLLARHQREAA